MDPKVGKKGAVVENLYVGDQLIEPLAGDRFKA